MPEAHPPGNAGRHRRRAQAAQGLIGSKVDATGLVLAKQFEKWLPDEIHRRRCPCLTGLPLQVLQHAAAVVARLDTDTLQPFSKHGQRFTAYYQRLGQRLLEPAGHIIFDHLGKPQSLSCCRHERSPADGRVQRNAEQGKTSSYVKVKRFSATGTPGTP